MWHLKYQNEFIDLAPDQIPEIERNSPLFVLENYLQEKTTPITINYSDKTSRQFGHIFFEQTKRSKIKIDVELHIDGSYFCNATLLIDSSNIDCLRIGKSSITGILVFGISAFFQKIKDKNLSALTLGGLRTFDYTSSNPTDGTDGYWQHAQSTFDFSQDYVFAPFLNETAGPDIEFDVVGIWRNRFDGTKIKINQPLIPFVKLGYLLEQLFAEHGWKLDTTGLNDAHWNKLLVYSYYVISTENFTVSGTTISKTNKGSISIDLRKAMPQNVKCSTFLFEICKRYFWAMTFDLKTNTCKLIALKEAGKKKPKDWTRYAARTFTSITAIEERIFAFKNEFTGDDKLPSTPDFSGYPTNGFAHSEGVLILPTYINDNSLYYLYLENKYVLNQYNEDDHAAEWQLYAYNIYDEAPENATDTFESKVTTLPVIRKMLDSGFFGYFPIVDQDKNSTWGIRTLLYHGMTKQTDEDGSPLSHTYPYASSLGVTPGQDIVLPWSNVLKHSDFTAEYGLINYWAKRWTQLIASPEEVTRRFYLPILELLTFQWDDLIIVNNLPFAVKSYIQPYHTKAEDIFIEAKLQPIKLITSAVDEIIIEDPEITRFEHETLIVGEPYDYVALRPVIGAPGATVTIKVIELDKSNPAFYFKANGTEYILNQTFTVTLDGSGTANINVHLGGCFVAFQAVMVRLKIMTTSIGTVTTDYYQYTAQHSKITG